MIIFLLNNSVGSAEPSEMFMSFCNHLLSDLKPVNKDLGQRHMEIVFWFWFLQNQISSKNSKESDLFGRKP